jgi:hypothetical protein
MAVEAIIRTIDGAGGVESAPEEWRGFAIVGDPVRICAPDVFLGVKLAKEAMHGFVTD